MYFDKNNFNAMMARKGYTREMLAKTLGISPNRLYRKLKNGNFTVAEIRKFIEVFGKEDVLNVFFNIKE